MNKFLKIQKTLRFIPYINFVTCFLWFFTVIKEEVPAREYMKKLTLLILIVFMVGLPRIIVSIISQNQLLYIVVVYLSLLIQCYIASFAAVKHQDEIINRRHKDN